MFVGQAFLPDRNGWDVKQESLTYRRVLHYATIVVSVNVDGIGED
jgi:hypothetical protein